MDVFIDDTTGEHWVVVAAGTSKGVSNLYTGEFAVSAKERKPFEKSGLALDTKFSVQQHSVARLPYNDDWFDVPPKRRITNQKTPLIGVLDQSYLRALQAAGSNANIA